MIVLAASAIGLLAIAEMSLRDWVLFNDSPSVPTGFYRRVDEPVGRGAFVTVRAVDVAPGYAEAREFTDAGDRFVKRVAAVSGERVCAEGSRVAVGALQFERASYDSSGRALPSWSGCRVLRSDEVFLLGDTADSFDSRYFGVVRLEEIEGVWLPL
ncbi:MAG: S26 family signal peptidase [Hyphomonadaceae bacterium]|nr:S26 family signal peptidase [Hyphomonadaceae bacterium]